MKGIELYAPREPKHRRTWTAAALVLTIVFITLGQIIAAIPGIASGPMTTQGEANGWPGTAYLLATFAFAVAMTSLAPSRAIPPVSYSLPPMKPVMFWR